MIKMLIKYFHFLCGVTLVLQTSKINTIKLRTSTISGIRIISNISIYCGSIIHNWNKFWLINCQRWRQLMWCQSLVTELSYHVISAPQQHHHLTTPSTPFISCCGTEKIRVNHCIGWYLFLQTLLMYQCYFYSVVSFQTYFSLVS